MRIGLLIAALASFLMAIGLWAFTLTDDLQEVRPGALHALALALPIILGLMAGFLWLGRRRR